jgi:hypothetical protein
MVVTTNTRTSGYHGTLSTMVRAHVLLHVDVYVYYVRTHTCVPTMVPGTYVRIRTYCTYVRACVRTRVRTMVHNIIVRTYVPYHGTTVPWYPYPCTYLYVLVRTRVPYVRTRTMVHIYVPWYRYVHVYVVVE